MFPVDTKVTISDFTEKPIGEIQLHDTLIVGDGVEPVVFAISAQSYEGDLIQIKYHEGKILACTPNQLLLTDRGAVKAKFLVPGDRLYTPYHDGGTVLYREVESTGHVSYSGEVRGLYVDGEGIYCAGGVIAMEDTQVFP